MFIIKASHYGQDGTYSKEEETATNEVWARTKYRRKLMRWVNILDCFHINVVDSYGEIRDFEHLTIVTQDLINKRQYELLLIMIDENNRRDDTTISFHLEIIEDKD